MKFLTQAAKVRDEQKKGKRRLAVFLCLAVVVALGTAAALKMYGQAMSHKDKRLICQLEVHQHTDACYDGDKLICGYADYVVHTHNDDCYDRDGNLVCSLPEMAAHTHTDECYTEQEVLLCGEEEGHTHTEECYTSDRGELLCQLEEHSHGEECYDPETGELTCQVEEHQHHDSCYEWKEVLTCAYASEGHVHSEECYTPERGELLCQTEEHTHGEECYDEANELICNLEEHTHSDDCYQWENVLTCQLEETQPGHTHTDACYGKEKVLTCGQLELHTHDENCQDENGALVCGLLELKEHTHQEECFEVVELTDEEVAEKLEEGKPEDGAGTVSEDATDSVSEDAYEHEHDETCYDAAGGLMCGYEDVEEEPDIVKTYEDDAYIVTAKYSEKANIPEEAELKAELITAESGAEHYAKREAEIKEALEDDTVSMNALVKIGFYVDEEEVEPEDDVVITVQFLDEDGMKDGSPIAVVHFAEGGSEVISGGTAKDKSTTFRTGKFSEFGIIEGYEVSENNQRKQKNDEKENEENREEKMVQVSETCEYNDDMFHALFRIEGEVKMSADQARAIELAEQKENGQQKQESGSEELDASSDIENVENDVLISDETQDEEESPDILENEEDISESPSEERGEDSGVTEEDEGNSGEISVDDELEDAGNSTDDSEGIGKDAPSGSGLEFNVEPVHEDAEEFAKDYAAVVACMDEASKGNDRIMLQVLSYSLLYEGEALDMSDCEVTVEVTPSQLLKETADEEDSETSDTNGEQEEVTLSVIQTMESEDADAAEGEKTGRIVSAATVSKLDRSLEVSLESKGRNNIMALSADSQANPVFTVEFYANIEQLATDKDEEANGKAGITVIDTSKNGDGNADKVSLENGGTMKTRKIYLNADNTVVKKNRLTEVYSPEEHHYIDSPGLVYFNKLAKNTNYKLTEIKVKRAGGDAWEQYDCSNGKEWHFTNKSQTKQEQPNKFILITAGATIRLVHDVTRMEQRNDANFYDYDVTDGKLYQFANKDDDKTYARNDAKTHDSNSSEVWYMYTNRQGINSNLKNQTFGFGNSEGTLKTTMGEIEGNKANSKNSKYGSPTFGLVTGLDDNGHLQYKSGVVAPKLFNESDGDVAGKTSYAGKLVFDQQGDTYTFTGTEVFENGQITSEKKGVDKFTRQRPNWNGTYYFAGNDFYPLDGVSSAGKRDLMFGKPTGQKLNEKGEPYDVLENIKSFSDSNNVLNMPISDDGQNHNHYFGMQYTIDFNLVKDYIGPLEYLFYGDDDMWVFLQKDGEAAKLVCDIGGVHSSVGEYVNLWDYIKKGDQSSEGHYKLTFFYTERGASGSTCWMQFTLPSVSFATTTQDTAKLKIEKKLTGSTDTTQEFGFEIQFEDEDGPLMNDYAYTKYNKTTGEVTNDILIWNNSKFTLKADEYIEISFLPDGSTYTIQEIGPVEITPGTDQPGVDLEWTETDNPYNPSITGGNPTDTPGKITGSVSKDAKVEIIYNNIHKFELPETGGAGPGMYIMIGFFCIVTGAVLVYRKKIVAKRV